jgi:fructose-1,6-bisphosphatase/inositol monophosphatase family enzyme
VTVVEPAPVLAALHAAADAIAASLGAVDDWGLAGTRVGQHHSDLAADVAGVAVLDRAGLGVLSEESGLLHADRPVLVVLDPLDGSTNAARGIPWYATSLCALDDAGLLAAVVLHLVSGVRYEAVRGGGARRDGVAIKPSGQTSLRRSIVGLSGFPPRWLGWNQYRALGAAALDLCAVADGVLDGYVDCSRDAHGSWDYLGGLLVCQEAGAVVEEALGRDLVVREPTERRTPVAAATPALLAQLLDARRSFV